MSAIEYERRIVHGIPVNVLKGATKTEICDLYTWNDKPIKFGKYNYSNNQFTIDDGFTESKEATDLLKAWRATQEPRSRADIRTGR